MAYNGKIKTMNKGVVLPQVTFPTRVRNDELGGDNPFEWRQVSRPSFLFGGKDLKKRGGVLTVERIHSDMFDISVA